MAAFEVASELERPFSAGDIGIGAAGIGGCDQA
jgi:hypothetical protein